MRKTWTIIRQDLKSISARDCLDYLEYEINLDDHIRNIRRKLNSGTYLPRRPSSFELAKSKGAYRNISMLHIEDALIYRILADEVYKRAKSKEVKGAYFSRKHKATPIGSMNGQFRLITSFEDFYTNPLRLWLRFNQYRTKVMLNAVHPYIVVTDITNYFESIHHELLLEHLSPLGLPRKAISLLANMLDTFKPINGGYSPNPKVGLAVEEFDASRQLAHVFLFEHDSKISGQFGSDNYVRWMDDQTVAVPSQTLCRQTVRRLTKSLSEVRLVLNSGKTKFLSAHQVVEEFHLDTNQELDDLTKMINQKKVSRPLLVKKFKRILLKARQLEHHGHWDKVLRRMYYVAGKLEWGGLRRNAYTDLVRYPAVSDRIFGYLASIGAFSNMLRLFQKYVDAGESLYESVEATFFETIIRHNLGDPALSRRYRTFCKDWIIKQKGTSRNVPKGVAAIALYWLGDRRSLRTIVSVLSTHGSVVPNSVARTLLVCLIALDRTKLPRAIELASEIGGPAVTSLLSLLRQFTSNQNLIPPVNEIFSARSTLAGNMVYDARAWLKLQILTIASSNRIQQWVQQNHKKLSKQSSAFGACEVRAFARLSESIH